MRRNALLLGLLCLILAAPASAAPPPEQARTPDGCDPLDPSVCMLPFPNDLYTTPDPSTPTGRRLDFSLLGMPRNVAGKPIDPTDMNRADGFSPGSLIITRVPGLDAPPAFQKTGAVPITDIARYRDRRQPVVLIDTATGARHPIWTELDMSVAQESRTLLIRPAKNLLEGHRYIVALRNLRDADGKPIPAPAYFRALRDRSDSADPGRRAHFESLFHHLARAGIERSSLYLTWDFTVASAESLAGRMLHIRDDAFSQLGDDNLADLKVEGDAPTFTIDKVVSGACEAGVPVGDLNGGLVKDCPDTNEKIVRDVMGTMIVPCYLSTPGCAPAHANFVLDPDGMPLQTGVMSVDFECRVPQAALDAGPGKARPSLYGHGLFGGYGEVRQGQLQDFAKEHNFLFCATDWAGMATTDVPNVATILTDLSHFNTLADRVQQGMLNFLYLGRLMIHPEGLSTDPAFQVSGDDHRSLIDTRRLFYDGNSQGGIIGGALAAVAPDYNRATLGVPGMNYSTLLTRSTDFGTGQPPTDGELEYAWPLYTSYPNEDERQLNFALMQLLWDRAEPNGYAQHMTDSAYPNTPRHEVMLHVALGDHQVAPVTADVEARTIGAKLLRRPAEDPGRNADVDPHYGITAFGTLPTGDSALVIWDSGSPVPPTANTSPTEGQDPHEFPRRTPAARAMKSAFLSLGSKVVDTCGGAPCKTYNYTPPAG